ncbi:50S ribosomal protein L19 [Desulfobacca acetoxidans]|uniref:Large ribosomal subunit protein bL19 n=1 Tax=Desulfobacca acetoxidans (strain ATCC 700848 / DSM 11109 / ASRB2) TaxID=880072 RepID=F2NF71_DESAR|nr:50S ribosomal protein L19 [Desulfobacca acetoxidans]AEB08626.1 50S ribosomal protein L19 [Desulfobacca acetoxidans DSM 11109]HAY23428.1 50S ribosomal protein L19 [Desulfobacterales bacterium]
MDNTIDLLEKEHMRADLPDFRAGDTVEVHVRIVEGDKERIQVFKGVVIRKRGSNTGASFTVRKISYEIGVERTFPLHSPSINEVRVISQGRVRRGRLYYLRTRFGKKARIKERQFA